MSYHNRQRRRLRRVWKRLYKKALLEFYTTKRLMTILGKDGVTLKDFDL